MIIKMLDIWFIKGSTKLNFQNYKSILSKKLYVNLNEKTNFNFLEKYVYDIAMFHINRLNYEENILIEYSLTNLDNFITNYDNIENETLLTTVTYFSHNNNPIIITNIDSEMYTYKEIYDNTKFLFLFPELFKHIAIEPNKFFYRHCKLFDNTEEDNIQLIVTLRKNVNLISIPETPLYIDNSTLSFLNFDKTTIPIKPNIVDKKLIDDILYNNKKILFNEIKHHFENEIISNRTFLTILDKPNDTIIANDKIKHINVKLDPRFIQRKVTNNFYNENVCDWIYSEIKMALTINNMFKVNNKIEMDRFPSIFSFFINSYSYIINIIKNTYSINDNVTYNTRELFVEVNEYNGDNLSEETNQLNQMISDKSDLTVKILLNDKVDYDNKGLLFEDNILSNLNKGDLIIYNGSVKYKETPIKRGIKLYLVVYIDLIIEKDKEWWEKELRD